MVTLSAYAGWGAIAYSFPEGVGGTSSGLPSLAAAQLHALLKCYMNGGTRCHVKTWERNQCAILARGRHGGVAWSTDNDWYAALGEGIERCYRFDSQCTIIAYACD
ncbi:DUF4189 domain-containing protein [Bradyrhizobium sp. 83002]|nr:DUF4189 domain-containing protein [Bradyrhizobium aeschynomenes]